MNIRTCFFLFCFAWAVSGYPPIASRTFASDETFDSFDPAFSGDAMVIEPVQRTAAVTEDLTFDRTGRLEKAKRLFVETDEEVFQVRDKTFKKISPSDLDRPTPAYPKLARERGWQGTVILKALIEKEGHPADVSVERSSGFKILDNAALETVRKWAFQPARSKNSNKLVKYE